MRLRPWNSRVALVVGVWMLVVALGSGLVWTVIAAVGEDLSGTGDAVPRPDPSVTSGPSPSAPRPSATRTAASDPPRPSRTESEPPPEPTARTETWTGPAGIVTTRCTGSRISLVRAVASADGYRVEVKDTGPDRVEVEFEGRGEDTDDETRVRAECAGGVPGYEVERR